MREPVYIVIPVYNRRAVTLRCLEQLRATGVTDWAHAVVVDDGSGDGTSEAVARDYPEAHLLHGDGNLWWTGAIRLGMQFAVAEGAQLIAWLNDDCLPDPGTLRRLADHATAERTVAAGWARTPSGGHYAGLSKTYKGIADVPPPAAEGIIRCDAACGNCVMIPRAVIDAIGYPDAAHLPHSLADCDYLLDATRAGFRVDLLGSATCRNDDNLQTESSSWLLSEHSPWRQWKLVFRSRKSVLHVPTGIYFHRKHWGLLGLWVFGRNFIKLALVCLVRLVAPVSLLRKLFAARSRAFQRQGYYETPSKRPT